LAEGISTSAPSKYVDSFVGGHCASGEFRKKFQICCDVLASSLRLLFVNHLVFVNQMFLGPINARPTTTPTNPAHIGDDKPYNFFIKEIFDLDIDDTV
jgi:hypothetical protein